MPTKKKRPINKLVIDSYNWWGKSFVFIKKEKIKIWYVIFAGAFISGMVVALAWSVSNDVHQASKAAGNVTFDPNSSDAVFVDKAYYYMLGRAADPGGAAAYISSLQGGVDRIDILHGFYRGSEHQNKYSISSMNDTDFLTHLYDHLLGRIPGQPEIDSWIIGINGGVSRDQVAKNFITSNEFKIKFEAYVIPVNVNSKLFVHYHTWYQKVTSGWCSNVGAGWAHWSWDGITNNPCDTLYSSAPWLRDISSPGYSLIGPYESINEEVIRWHIKLAQAAGIDGFIASLYSPTLSVGFDALLKVAEEESFNIAIEGWYPVNSADYTDPPTPTDIQDWKNYTLQNINNYANHPAYLKVNNKPVLWFNNYSNWLNGQPLIDFLEQQVAFWIMGADDNIYTPVEISDINSQLNNSELSLLIDYNLPSMTGWTMGQNFTQRLSDMRSAGNMAISHAYPGFDEVKIKNNTGSRPGRKGTRNNGQTLEDFFTASDSANADIILIESFNDWNEYHQIEPGFDVKNHIDVGQENIYNGNPYTYLEIIANYKNKQWITPSFNCSIVDKYLLYYNKGATGCIEPSCIDNDGDGHGQGCVLGNDCDDFNPNVNPFVDEVCGNGIDDDCYMGISQSPPCHVCDADSDGFARNDGSYTSYCNRWYQSLSAGDCDDENVNINPNAVEICDSIDNDCNGLVDDFCI